MQFGRHCLNIDVHGTSLTMRKYASFRIDGESPQSPHHTRIMKTLITNVDGKQVRREHITNRYKHVCVSARKFFHSILYTRYYMPAMMWVYSVLAQSIQRYHPHARKSASKPVLLEGCSSPFMELALHLTTFRAWCKQFLSGL